MFAALDAIKNTIFSLNPLPKTISKPLDTISSVIEDDNEPIIDHPDPLANINTPLPFYFIVRTIQSVSSLESSLSILSMLSPHYSKYTYHTNIIFNGMIFQS